MLPGHKLVIREAGTSIEELPTPDWPVGMTLAAFPCLMIDSGVPRLLWAKLSLGKDDLLLNRKVVEQARETNW